MAHPFRFGVQLGKLEPSRWKDEVREIERLGYSSIHFPDHFGDQWEPVSAMAAVAAVTERLILGALVFDVDYRHPVILAKSMATISAISGGRVEFGIGAGWMKKDYVEAGLVFDPPGVRVARLEEAIQIIRSMWGTEKTSFDGEHFEIDRIGPALESAPPVPRVLVGGGGKRVLSIAGRFGDIVGINPVLAEGRITSRTAADMAPERVREKVSWVRRAAERAGRDPDDLELSVLVFVTAMVDDPSPIRSGLASATNMSEEEVAACPLFLTGPPAEIRDRLIALRDETGISYVVIQAGNQNPPGTLERFSEDVAAQLSGK